MKRFNIVPGTRINSSFQIKQHIIDRLNALGIYDQVIYNITLSVYDKNTRAGTYRRFNNIEYIDIVSNADSTRSMICSFFLWAKTPEGEHYWKNIYDIL